jgi:putative glutamine amidotransferase
MLLAPVGLSIENVLELIDGLILSGGGDVDPSTFSGGQHETVYSVNPQRDAFELELAKCVMGRPELPLLGICRGMQVLNIALGGDLDLHIPDVHGETVVHRLPPREPTYHPVRLESGSLLESIYQQNEFPVCSWHHQAVRRLGAGLRPIAYATDGLIEGVVHDEHPFVLGVQWHPEMQVADDPLQRRLFEAFVGRAGRSA